MEHKIKHTEKQKVRRNAANRDKKGTNTNVKRELLLALDGAVYGQVLKALGSARFDVLCFDDGRQRQCSVRKSKNTLGIKVGSTVMVGLRDYQDTKADIVYLYTPEEVMELKRMGLITKTVTDGLELCSDDDMEDIGFDFDAI